MSKVQIDDYNCVSCNKFGIGELDIKTGEYKSMFCDCEDEFGKLKKQNQDLRGKINKKLSIEFEPSEVDDIEHNINKLVENELKQEELYFHDNE